MSVAVMLRSMFGLAVGRGGGVEAVGDRLD
jgi:hypothetical protein